jgi:hypothetical protein
MARKVQAWELAGRLVMRSPGRPPIGRLEHRQAFWRVIARGLSSEDAAAEAGVSGPVGVRWFREGGGMPSVTLAPASGRYLSFAEREEIAILRAQGRGVRLGDQLGSGHPLALGHRGVSFSRLLEQPTSCTPRWPNPSTGPQHGRYTTSTDTTPEWRSLQGRLVDDW